MLLIFLAVLCSAATVPATQPASSNVNNIVWSQMGGTFHGRCRIGFSPESVAAWDRQIVARWPGRKVTAFFCHGDTDSIPWQLDPDEPMVPVFADAVQKMLHREAPDRLIVMICCNPQHTVPTEPNVAYAESSVWIVPGPDRRFLFDENRWASYPGNIWEFKVTKGTKE